MASDSTLPATAASPAKPTASASATTTAKPGTGAMPPASSGGTAQPGSATALVPPERTMIFPAERAAAFVRASCFVTPEGITDYWTPTPKDLEGVEASLEKYVEAQGRAHRASWAKEYRQVAGLNFGKERFLLFSYFTQDLSPAGIKLSTAIDPKYDADRWKKEPFYMNDGGDDYFRTLYDVQKKQFTWYEHNADA